MDAGEFALMTLLLLLINPPPPAPPLLRRRGEEVECGEVVWSTAAVACSAIATGITVDDTSLGGSSDREGGRGMR